MTRLVILLHLAIYQTLSLAQKQNNLWFFGTQNQLNFSSGLAVYSLNGMTGTDVSSGSNQEGTSVICDSTGNLLFYTGGKTIWNRNHLPMPNGSGIAGGTSSTESSLIIPSPGNDSLFYVFTSDEFQSYYTPPCKGYRYNLVNMCLDGGYGDVDMGTKNILLLDSSTEKLSACIDAQGTGYWVMGHKMFSDEFHAWHITSAGISTNVITHIGTVHGKYNSTWINGAAMGEMKFNSTGSKLAAAIGNNIPAIVDLMTFDPLTGILSNLCHITIDSALYKQIYGIEFSPDGSKLYAGVVGGTGGKRIYQYNLQAGGGDCDSVLASRVLIYQSFANSIMYGMQLAPDNKIYTMCSDLNTVGRINNPNLSGTACNLDTAVFTNVGKTYNFPVIIAGYKYLNDTVNCNVNSIRYISQNTPTLIYPNPTPRIATLTSAIGWTLVRVYNSLGDLIYENKNRAHEQQIDLGNHPAGIYFVRVKMGTEEKVIKLVKIDP